MRTMNPAEETARPSADAPIVVDLGERPAKGAYRGRHASGTKKAPDRLATALRVRRYMFVALAIAFGVFWLLENVVASVMYDSRQSHLAADFAIARPATSVGDAVAILQATQIDLNVMVIEGDAPEQLQSGPGRRVKSGGFGSAGNVVVQGHADRFGGPFAKLSELRKDAQIFAEYRGGKVAEYRVMAVKKSIQESDATDLASTEAGQLTLVTSSGGLTGSERLVVTAKLVDTPNAAPLPKSQNGGFETSNEPTWWRSPAIMVVALVALVALGLWAARRFRFGVAIVLAAGPLVAALVVLWTLLDGVLPLTT